MAKRKPEEPKKGAPEWQTTFSDLMNLLLCFFVLLFSMSTVDEAKYNELVASMSSAFSILDGGATAIGDGILVSNGVSQLNDLAQYINSMGASEDGDVDSTELDEYEAAVGTIETDEQYEIVGEAMEKYVLQENEELAEKITESVVESNMADQIEVNFTGEYVLLTVKGGLLFDSGKAELKESSIAVMDKVGAILERYSEGTIEIEGHTDTVPMSSGNKYKDNNELSSARALTVFNYLMDNTLLEPANIKHSGRGEYVPIADNSTAEGRAKNRRVEIKIYNPPIP